MSSSVPTEESVAAAAAAAVTPTDKGIFNAPARDDDEGINIEQEQSFEEQREQGKNKQSNNEQEANEMPGRSPLNNPEEFLYQQSNRRDASSSDNPTNKIDREDTPSDVTLAILSTTESSLVDGTVAAATGEVKLVDPTAAGMFADEMDTVSHQDTRLAEAPTEPTNKDTIEVDSLFPRNDEINSADKEFLPDAVALNNTSNDNIKNCNDNNHSNNNDGIPTDSDFHAMINPSDDTLIESTDPTTAAVAVVTPKHDETMLTNMAVEGSIRASIIETVPDGSANILLMTTGKTEAGDADAISAERDLVDDLAGEASPPLAPIDASAEPDPLDVPMDDVAALPSEKELSPTSTTAATTREPDLPIDEPSAQSKLTGFLSTGPEKTLLELRQQVEYLEHGARYNATKTAIQHIQAHYLEQLREIRSTLLTERDQQLQQAAVTHSSLRQQIDAARVQQATLLRQQAQMEFRVHQLLASLTALRETHKGRIMQQLDINKQLYQQQQQQHKKQQREALAGNETIPVPVELLTGESQQSHHVVNSEDSAGASMNEDARTQSLTSLHRPVTIGNHDDDDDDERQPLLAPRDPFNAVGNNLTPEATVAATAGHTARTVVPLTSKSTSNHTLSDSNVPAMQQESDVLLSKKTSLAGMGSYGTASLPATSVALGDNPMDTTTAATGLLEDDSEAARPRSKVVKANEPQHDRNNAMFWTGEKIVIAAFAVGMATAIILLKYVRPGAS